MKKLTVFFTIFFLFPAFSHLKSQEGTDTLTSTIEDTVSTPEDDAVRKQVSEIIKEVNTRSDGINNIISSGELKVKTAQIDNSGDIEIHIKKKDDVWFKIEGPFGKDVAIAHFDRKRFLFYDALNDEAITGTTNVINIGTLTRIRCTFDDMLNAFSGTVRIPKAKKDSLWIEDDGSQYVLGLKRGTITRKYWVDKTNYSVFKYVYYDKKGQILIQFEFSNFVAHGDGYYAKTVEVRRPKKNEYFRLKMESVSLNQTYLDFKVDVPSDAVRKNWH
jgi:outer membrane lipoprotein-sorting protein